MDTAHTILCDACGGTIPLRGIPSSVACPFCKHEQAIDAARRRELESYQRDVGGAVDRAAAERVQAEQWDRWYGGRGGRSKYSAWAAPILFLCMLVPMIGFAFVAQAWMTSGRPMPALAPPLMSAGFMGIFVVVYGVYLVWFYGGKKRASAARAGAATAATCPRCGAPNALAPGQVLERCSHCGTSLLPSATLMRAGLSAAEAAAREAAMRRYRAEREGMASLMRMSVGGGSAYLIIGSFLPVTVGAAVAFSADALQNGTKEPGGLAMIWALAAFNVGLIALIWLWRRRIQRRWATMIRDASRPFPHRILTNLDDMVAWLNRYWAAPVPHEDLSAGSHLQVSVLAIGELAGLLVLNPTARSEGTPVYAAVFLAAWIPSLHGRQAHDADRLAPLRTRLERAGFRLSLSEAGLLARADAETLRRLAKNPAAGALLAQMVGTLGEAAAVVEAVRVDPIP